MPYPNINNVEVRERVNNFMERNHLQTGQELLDNQCMRSVNQTIGRAIRHAKDYSAIILVDSRYSSLKIRRKLPDWLEVQGESETFPAAFSKLVAVKENVLSCNFYLFLVSQNKKISIMIQIIAKLVCASIKYKLRFPLFR